MAAKEVDNVDAWFADIKPVSHVPLPSSVLVRTDGVFTRAFAQSTGGMKAVDVVGVMLFGSFAMASPGVIAGEVINANTVDVVFDSPMVFDAEMLDLSAWATSDPRVAVIGVVAAGAYRARLTVNEMKGGKSYTFTVPADVVSDIGSLIDASRRAAVVVGVGRQPRVSRVELLSSTSMRVRFDERMRDDGALRSPQSYSITTTAGWPAFVGGVEPEEIDTEIRSVILAITEQTNGAAYALAVSIDVVDVAGNGVDAAFSSAAFLGVGVAPKVLRIEAKSPNRVDVVFDETIRRDAGSLAPASYTFSGGLTVLAVLAVVGNRVSLSTSTQTPGVTYTLSIGA